MFYLVTALAVIFVFFIIVLVHELGHFTVAKLIGVKVHEFAIGMGPKIFKFGKGETQYTLRALPLGGFVKMEGEDENSDDERSLNKKPVLSRIAVFAAGATMNFILAIVIFSIISFYSGAATTIIDQLNQDLPAYQAGLKSGDKIIKINEENIDSWDEIVNEIDKSDGNMLTITVLRDGQTKVFSIVPQIREIENGVKDFIVGITPKISRNLGDMIISGFKKTFFFIGLMFEFIGSALRGKVGVDQVAGPVGVISLVGKAAQFGFLNVLYIAGFLSVNLGFLNLLPIPALDGSRIMFGIIELFRGKPIDPEKEGLIHFIGFVCMLILVIFISYVDITRIGNYR